MRLEVSEINIDVKRHISKVRSNQFWLFAAQQWYRLYQKYVPMDTGTLANQVIITPGQIEHTAPYARYIYDGKRFNFRKDPHPLASAKWDKAGEPTQKPKLVRTLQAYVDRGGLNLGK